MLVKLTAVLRHQRARKGADAPAPVALEAAWAACGLTTFGKVLCVLDFIIYRRRRRGGFLRF